MQYRDDVRKATSLQHPEAFNIEWLHLRGTNTQEATQYTRVVYKQSGTMQMSVLQESFWRQKEKLRSDERKYHPCTKVFLYAQRVSPGNS